MFQSRIKFIPSLLYSIIILALFYWQFNVQYSTIIANFTEEKLSILYAYLFIYLFGILIFTITMVNLLHYLAKDKAFVIITLLTLIIFYALSFGEFYHIIKYFINYPFDSNTIMGMIFFMLLSLGYALYSMSILYFKDRMPFSHILIFSLLSGGYVLYFINQYTPSL